VGEALRSASPESLRELRDQFSHRHHVAVQGFFGPALIDEITQQLAIAEFEQRIVEGVGSEWVMKPNKLSAMLNWMVNEAELVEIVRQVTGCADIGYFVGRIFRLEPAPGPSLRWHDDRGVKDRQVAVSVNLGTRPHSGGELRLREKGAHAPLAGVSNRGAGDAVLFRVADQLEHSVTAIEGTVPRLAYAGWFVSGPNYYSSLMRERAEPDA
jgi:hypothetical protein